MIKFNYPDDIQHMYTRRYCLRLAKALCRCLGGNVHAVVTDTGTAVHYVVMHNNVYIDIIGIFTRNQLLEYWRIQRPDVIISDIVCSRQL